MLTAIKTTTSPTLASGAIAITIGEFEKIEDAQVSYDAPLVSDYVFDCVVTISGNIVTATFKKMQCSATNTWGNAVTSDLNLKKVVVLAQGV